MDRLELRLLGSPRVFIDGRETTFRTRKTLALLVYLAAEGGMHRRGKLAELLWPTSTSRRGRATLRTALAGIRRALSEGTTGLGDGILRVEGDLLGVNAGPGLELDLDVLREISAISRAPHLVVGKNEELISTFRSAGAAYRGEFLEGFELDDAPGFDLWVEAQRSLWRARVGEVLGRLAELEAEAGQLAAAAGTAEAWVARDPMEEAARVGLMEARSAAGDRGGALAAYEEYRSELQLLGMVPGPGTETVTARIRTQGEEIHTGEGGRPTPGSLGMPFVGRKADFEALVEEYRAAREGQTRTAVVVGEAGIGKTRLMEEFLGWAASRGADTVCGRTLETETHLPYEALVDLVRPRLERERAPVDLLDDRWLAELSRIMPELRDRYPDLPAPTADEASSRALLFEAVARLGAALAGRSAGQGNIDGTGEPLVVFLDDLQWADGATLDALSYACRSWARDEAPLLLLMAARDEGLVKDNLGGWLSSLGRGLPARRLPLATIGEEDIKGLLRLLAGAVGPGDSGAFGESELLARWLWEESDGHPLFLVQILGVLLQRGVLVERAGRDGRREVVLSGEGFDEGELRGLIPAGLRELIRNKLRPLPADASDILTAGAVLGRGFGFGELLRVSGVGESEGLAALDDLVSARLLEESGTPSRWAYSFAHDKIREIVYTEAGEARREVFHRRALRHLEDRGAPTAELARHALAARLSDKAFRYLLAAAEEAMAVFAASDAIGYYERARDLLEDPSWGIPASENHVPERLRLYGGLARARALVHDWARAREAYEKMLAAAREVGYRPAEWEALYGLGVLEVGFTVGPDDDELLRGVRRREKLAGLDGTANAAEEGPEYAIPGTVGGSRDARRDAEQALLLARELGQEDLIRRSEFALGVAYAWTGLWKESAAHMEEARALYAAAGDRAMEAQSLVYLTWSHGLLDSPASALESYGKGATEIWEALDIDYGRAALGALGTLLTTVGEYEDAIGMASRGFEAARSLGISRFMYLSLRSLGDAHRETFALREARAAYSDMFGWTPLPMSKAGVHARLCAVAALAGEWKRAREHALEALELRKYFFLSPTDLHHHHDIEALLRGGDAGLARDSFRSFERRTRGQKGSFRLAYLRAAAVLARWEGDIDEALSHLREALGLAERLGLPGELWQVCATLGEVYEERGEIGPSERAFDRSAVVVRELASKISDQNLREGFLAAPQTRRVLENSRAREAGPGFRTP